MVLTFLMDLGSKLLIQLRMSYLLGLVLEGFIVTIKKVNTIEQLGSGAAYLHLLHVLRPGVVRPERIINDPQNHYEATTNLKLLASAFERLNLQHCFEVMPHKSRLKK